MWTEDNLKQILSSDSNISVNKKAIKLSYDGLEYYCYANSVDTPETLEEKLQKLGNIVNDDIHFFSYVSFKTDADSLLSVVSKCILPRYDAFFVKSLINITVSDSQVRITSDDLGIDKSIHIVSVAGLKKLVSYLNFQYHKAGYCLVRGESEDNTDEMWETYV